MTTVSDRAPATNASWSGWLDGGQVVDVVGERILPPAALRIADGLIAEITDHAPPGAPDIVDCDGLFLLPGLASCHVHLQATYPYSERDPNEPAATTALRASGHASRIRRSGITTVRTVHEQSQADLFVRDAAAKGWVSAPRIVAGGRALTTPGGHGDGLGAVVASGPDGFRRAALGELAAGADHVKIFASGGLAREGEALDRPEMTRDEMAAAVQAAAEQGTYVVAHAASTSAIRLGLEAGVRCFEHAYVLDLATARELAGAHAYLTPTLVVTHALDWMETAGFDASAVDRSRRMAAIHVESAAAAIESGVTILHGTDFPPAASSHGTSLAILELELLIRAGMSTAAALRAATVSPGELMGFGPSFGTLVPGAPADVVAVTANPFSSVSALRSLSTVVAGGELVQTVSSSGGTEEHRVGS
jgi:imidazolonepropionase-like amidohydrolase